MEHKYSFLSLEDLRELYQRESHEFQQKLLDGAAWSELKDHRRRVTKLAIAFHKKTQQFASMNPAESPSDEMENRKLSQGTKDPTRLL